MGYLGYKICPTNTYNNWNVGHMDDVIVIRGVLQEELERNTGPSWHIVRRSRRCPREVSPSRNAAGRDTAISRIGRGGESAQTTSALRT